MKWLPLMAGAAIAPVVVASPKPQPQMIGDVRTIDDAITRLDAAGDSGWELVQSAVDLVNSQFSAYSAWHLWESPEVAFRNSRGFSIQYNVALAQILRGLGFEVEVVHAARVRGATPRPWWRTGRTWLRVTHDGRTRDVSAGRQGPVGELCFTPVSEVRAVNPWTTIGIRLAMTPLVAFQVWKAWLTRRPVPAWIYAQHKD